MEKIFTIKTPHKATIKILLIAVGALTLILCTWGIITLIAQQGIEKQLSTIETRYNAKIKYKNISLGGLNQIILKNVTFIPKQSNLRFHASNFAININLLTPPSSAKDIQEFEITDLDIYYIPSATIRKKAQAATPNYANITRDLFDGLTNIFPNLPPRVSIRNLRIIYQKNNGDETTYTIPAINIAGNNFNALMTNGDTPPTPWYCQGRYIPKNSQLNLRLYRDKSTPAELPLLKNNLNTTIKFDTLAINIQRQRTTDNRQTLRGKLGIKGLTIDHTRLNYEPVFLDKAFANFKLNIGDNHIELDSSATRVIYKRLQFSPYLHLAKNKDWHIRAAIDKTEFPINDLFRSLPPNTFSNLEGIKVAGKMTYHFLLDLDMTNIDNLTFESSADTRNFKILSFGNTDLSLMSQPFQHAVYDKGKKIRDIEVSEANPNFAPIKRLPRHLLQAILYAEDYSYYNHRGFFPEAFHRSLVENLKTKRFTRGASTLTMQVVKNVFLGHNKLASRKLEEILIVWLIENNHLTTKDRMYEVYLNIIEWGPDIYGITEAARYYFIKEPPALTLSESIFLAYIIPNPRKLAENFNGMRPNTHYYEFFDDMLKRMKRHGTISNAEATRANPRVNLRGAVVNFVRQNP
jgi:hypothetical protein